MSRHTVHYTTVPVCVLQYHTLLTTSSKIHIDMLRLLDNTSFAILVLSECHCMYRHTMHRTTRSVTEWHNHIMMTTMLSMNRTDTRHS